MDGLNTRASTLFLGVALGFVLAKATSGVADARETGRLIVGMKTPPTPAVVKELAKETKGKIVAVGPGGAFVLLLPKKGTTAEQVERAHRNISYVEPEIVMGVDDPRYETVLVVPMKRLPGKVVGPPADIAPKGAATK